MTTKNERRGQLNAMTKTALASLYRTGVRRPGGGTTRWLEGDTALERQRKDEIIAQILAIEFPS